MAHVRPSPPDIDGYLDKLKHKKTIFGSWNKRYFRVNPKEDRIEYFSSKQSALIDEPSGTISLANLRSIKRFDDNSFNIDGGPDGVYLLRTDSQAQLTCWMNEIDSYIRARQAYERYLTGTDV